MESTKYEQITKPASLKIVRKHFRWSTAAMGTLALGLVTTVVLALTPSNGGSAAAHMSGRVTSNGYSNFLDHSTQLPDAIPPLTLLSWIQGAAAQTPAPRAYVTNQNLNNVSVIDTGTHIVVDSVDVGTQPRAVAVTPDGTRAYVVNYGSNNVSVVETLTNTVVATVAVGTQPYGVAITPNGARAYVTNSGSQSVSVLDTASNTVMTTVALGPIGSPSSGREPQGIAITPDGSRAYVASHGSASVWVIATSTNTVAGTVNVGGQPLNVAIGTTPSGVRTYVTDDGPSNKVSVINTATNTVVTTLNFSNPTNAVAVTPDGTRAYVTHLFTSNVSVIATATNAVTNLAAGVQPNGVAFAPDSSFAYLTNSANKVYVFDTAASTQVGVVNVGSAPFGVAIAAPPAGLPPLPDPGPAPRVYVTNRFTSNVSIIDTATDTLVANVRVGNTPYGVAVTPDGSRVYVTNQASNNVSVIATTSNTVVATIAVGSSPTAVAVTPDGSRAYVVNQASNNVSVIDTVTNGIIATVAVGIAPTGVAIGNTSNGTRAYVTNQNLGSVTVIRTDTNAVVATVPAGFGASGVAITPTGSRVYVANFSSGNVTVINTATNTVLTTVTVGGTPRYVAVTPDGSRAYVSLGTSTKVIATANNMVSATITGGTFGFFGLAFTLDGTRAYAADASQSVQVVDTDPLSNTVNTVVGNVLVGGINPEGVAMVTPPTPTPTPTPTSSANLSITKTSRPDPGAEVGAALTYTLTIGNGGPSTASSVAVMDTLPASVTFNSVITTQGTCQESGGVVSCDLGSVAAGATVTVTIDVTPNTPGTISNTATVSASEVDPNTANNSATVTTTIKAGTITTITGDSPDPSVSGQIVTITYSVTVKPPESGTPTGNVKVTATTGETCTGSLAAGSCSILFTSPGARALWASYEGDANFNRSNSADELHNVNIADTCRSTTVQITNTTGDNVPPRHIPAPISGDGTHIAFLSSANIVNNENPDLNNELFVYDATTNITKQITHTVAPDVVLSQFSITIDGGKIAFSSYQGSTDAEQIFVYDDASGSITQITHGIHASHPQINSYDGTRISFISSDDLVPGSNPSHIWQLFLYEATTDSFRQLSFESDPFFSSISSHAISGDGTRIAFTSKFDPLGQNPAHRLETFLFDTTTDAYTQLTHGTLTSWVPPILISADGTKIGLQSDVNPATGASHFGARVYLYNIADQTWAQAVADPTGVPFPPKSPSLNYDATIFAFSSFADLTGNNADNSEEVQSFDAVLRTFDQLTDAQRPYFSFVPSISANGTKTAFVSDADHVSGQNADHNLEVFLATCPAFRTFDFAFHASASPPTLPLTPSSTKTSEITLRSINGVSEMVQLSAAWRGAAPAGAVFTLAPGNLTVPSTGRVSSILSVSTSASPSAGRFTLAVTGTSASGVTKSVDVSIVIASRIDFTASATPQSLPMTADSTKTSEITLQSVNGVSETVQLSAAWSGAAPTGTTFQLSPGNVTVPATGQVSSTLTVSTSASPSPGTFTLTITGTSASGVTKSVDVSLVIASSPPAPCACSETGTFEDPRVEGLKPASLATVTVSAGLLTLTRNSDGKIIVNEARNVSAFGFSPNGKFFVLITQQTSPTVPVFSLTLYSVPAGGVLGSGSPLVDNVRSWGFSPDNNNSFLVVTSSISLNTSVDVNIYSTQTGMVVMTNSISDYSSFGPPPWTNNQQVVSNDSDDNDRNDNNKVGGWGFSPDGNTFVLSYKTAATRYFLGFWTLTRNPARPVFGEYRPDVASFWQFSPCGDLFMLVKQAGANPAPTDVVDFLLTSNGLQYWAVNLAPSQGSPSATVVSNPNGSNRIQLTGMSVASIPSPQCTTAPSNGPSPPTCGCTKTGNFKDPRVKGLVAPNASGNGPADLARVTIESNKLTLTRNSDGRKIVDEASNVSAFGFSPNGKFFVLITQLSSPTVPVFSLTLYSVPAGGVLGAGSPLVTNVTSWGFSPDNNNSFLVATSSISLSTSVDVNIFSTQTGRVVMSNSISDYSSFGPPPWTNKQQVVDNDSDNRNANNKVGGWGFSPDGNTFALSYKTAADRYFLSLWTLTGTRTTPVFGEYRPDVASFWQFSPCGDLFMLVKQAGANPAPTDVVDFLFTSNGRQYLELNLAPSQGSPSATVVSNPNGSNRIQLTGMSVASIPSPQCTTSVTLHSPANITLTDALGRKTGFDPVTGGTVNQIPGGSYTGVGSEPQTVVVPYVAGTHIIDVIGLDSLTAPEPYTLTIATADASGEVFAQIGLAAMASRGKNDRYPFTVDGNGIDLGYNFNGFFQPIDNPPTLNIASAGSSIPVKFYLGGNLGLAIFAAGYPSSSPIQCDASDPGAVIEETVTAGGSSLSYDPSTNQYSYVWKTDKAWKGTCRMLVVRLNDNTQHLAKFKFR